MRWAWIGFAAPAILPALGILHAPAQDDPTDALGGNAACYVCHIPFVKEELAKTHLAARVTCIQCHGPSAKHANDEHIGATKPDVTYTRDRIDPACVKCHERHDVPARAIVERFRARKLPADRAPTCTECHGTHRIDRAAG
jgi:hypothetical protein